MKSRQFQICHVLFSIDIVITNNPFEMTIEISVVFG